MAKRFKLFIANESGATAVEYALLCGIMTLAILAALTIFANKISNTFNEVASNVN